MATKDFPDPAAEDEKELEFDLDEMMADLQELQVGNGLSNCLITMTLSYCVGSLVWLQGYSDHYG